MKLNNKGFALSSIVYSILILFILLIFCILSILGSRKMLLDKTRNDVLNKLQENENFNDNAYKDESGANAPELLDGMVPIMIKAYSPGWVVADIENEWYDYTKGKWANAVVLKDNVTKSVGDKIDPETDVALWYVWIPRFKYNLFNMGGSYTNCTGTSCPEIVVEFEQGIENTGTVSCIQNLDSTLNKTEICSDNSGSLIDGVSTYTHPAFTLGDKELTGFWIGKFEISETNSKITILPNKTSLSGKTPETLFNLVKNISSSYNINGDSHMIKNIEWGAVAYLKQSTYGKKQDDMCLNRSNETGYAYDTIIFQNGGTCASSTNNYYGVYDMSGGKYEVTVSKIGNSNFEQQYVDKYIGTDLNKLGDATIETKGFYQDQANFPNSSYPWFLRGGYNSISPETAAGIFAYTNNNISNSFITTRAILTK